MFKLIFGSLLSFIPGVGLLQGVFEFLKPIFKVLGEFLAWFFKEIIWEGIKDILDNLATFILVALLCVCTYYYSLNYGYKRVAAEQEIVKLVKQVNYLKTKCGARCGK